MLVVARVSKYSNSLAFVPNKSRILQALIVFVLTDYVGLCRCYSRTFTKYGSGAHVPLMRLGSAVYALGLLRDFPFPDLMNQPCYRCIGESLSRIAATDHAAPAKRA